MGKGEKFVYPVTVQGRDVVAVHFDPEAVDPHAPFKFEVFWTDSERAHKQTLQCSPYEFEQIVFKMQMLLNNYKRRKQERKMSGSESEA